MLIRMITTHRKKNKTICDWLQYLDSIGANKTHVLCSRRQWLIQQATILRPMNDRVFKTKAGIFHNTVGDQQMGGEATENLSWQELHPTLISIPADAGGPPAPLAKPNSKHLQRP